MRRDCCLIEAIAKLGHALVAIIMSIEMRIHEQLTGEDLAPVDISQMQGERLDQREVHSSQDCVQSIRDIIIEWGVSVAIGQSPFIVGSQATLPCGD